MIDDESDVECSRIGLTAAKSHVVADRLLDSDSDLDD